ncbi:MAG: DOMON-like domain-containing protein [Thermodesulfobacteriota bacterium]
MAGTFAVAGDRVEPAMLPLAHHPCTPLRARVTVAGGAALEGASLRLRFTLRGDLASVALPAPAAAPARRDGLWRHTCFEAFLAGARRRSYVETNLAPSEDWAAYVFDDRRSGMRPAPVTRAPLVSQTRAAAALTLDAQLDLEPLAALLGEPPYALGLCAVIAPQAGAHAYLALAHPAAHPDFHDRGGWTASLPPPEHA